MTTIRSVGLSAFTSFASAALAWSSACVAPRSALSALAFFLSATNIRSASSTYTTEGWNALASANVFATNSSGDPFPFLAVNSPSETPGLRSKNAAPALTAAAFARRLFPVPGAP